MAITGDQNRGMNLTIVVHGPDQGLEQLLGLHGHGLHHIADRFVALLLVGQGRDHGAQGRGQSAGKGRHGAAARSRGAGSELP